MADDNNSDIFSEFGKWFRLAADCNQVLFEDVLEHLNKPQAQAETVFNTLSSLLASVLSSDPDCIHRLIDNQLNLITDQLNLLEAMAGRLRGEVAEPVIAPEEGDRRFSDTEWSVNPFFDFIKQSYLLNNRALFNMVDSMSLGSVDQEKVGFFARQFSSALAPTNFPFSNPEIVRRIQESNGESLFRGLKQLLEDQKKSGEVLNVCMSDSKTFHVGRNLATTAGKVVYENDLMQLIQYQPVRNAVFEIPMLFVPSWINKFYVYDLRDSNSMVKWAVEKGFTVFMISWVNPDARHSAFGFDDYIRFGVLEALEKIKAVSGSDSVNCTGYCLGGALLASAAAYLSARGDESIQSFTCLATSVDFTDPGDFRVLLDERLSSGMAESLKQDGYFDGRKLAVSFSMLRENELYWNYYVQNYLKGERPGAFDILHWNSDSTNVTANMHLFVLNDLVTRNMFVRQEGFTVLGQRVDLRGCTTPGYFLAAEKDHIARWQSCYAGPLLKSGESRFVLAGSGHIAGVINPANRNKYYYYTNHQLPEAPEDWLADAFRHEGSWWRDWYCWLSLRSGARRAPLTIEESDVIEEAPGRFVMRRLDAVDTAGASEAA